MLLKPANVQMSSQQAGSIFSFSKWRPCETKPPNAGNVFSDGGLVDHPRLDETRIPCQTMMVPGLTGAKCSFSTVFRVLQLFFNLDMRQDTTHNHRQFFRAVWFFRAMKICIASLRTKFKSFATMGRQKSGEMHSG